jgi:tetratricopeptide (TPR) repeat protein
MIGQALLGQGRAADAMDYFQQARDGARRTFGATNRTALLAMRNIGDALAAQGEIQQAVVQYDRLLEIAVPAYGKEDGWVAAWICSRADLHRQLGRLEAENGNHTMAQAFLQRAEEGQREALRLRQETIGPRHAETLLNMHRLAEALRDRGENDEAEALWRDAIVIAEETLSDNSIHLITMRSAYGAFLVQCGRYDEAEPLLIHAVRHAEELLSPDHRRTVLARQRLAELRQRQAQGGATTIHGDRSRLGKVDQ